MSLNCHIYRPLTRQQPILLPGEENPRKSGIPPGPSITSGGSATPPPGTGTSTSGKYLFAIVRIVFVFGWRLLRNKSKELLTVSENQ